VDVGYPVTKGISIMADETTLPVTHDTGALCLHQALSRSMICDGLNAFLSVNVLCNVCHCQTHRQSCDSSLVPRKRQGKVFKLVKLSPRDNYEAQKWMIHRGHVTDARKSKLQSSDCTI
jgi:hypothetical protein